MYVTKKLKNPYSKDFKFVLNNIFWKAFFNFCCFQTFLVGRLEGWKVRKLEGEKVKRLEGSRVFLSIPLFSDTFRNGWLVGILAQFHRAEHSRGEACVTVFERRSHLGPPARA